MKEHRKTLSRAIKQLIFEEPFYGTFLMSMDKEFTTSIDTLGVGLENFSVKLLINPNYWQTLNEKRQKGVIKHECMHVTLFHLTDFDDLAHRYIANIAKDMQINQFIDRDCLPEGCVFLDSIPGMTFEPKMGTRHYYKKLIDSLPPSPSGGGGSSQQNQSQEKEENDEGEGGGGNDGNQQGNKQQSQEEGSEGDEGENENDDDSGNDEKDNQDQKQNQDQGDGKNNPQNQNGDQGQNGKNQSTGNALGDLIANGQVQNSSGGITKLPKHDWKVFDDCTPQEKKLIRNQVGYMVTEVADAIIKSRGTIPSEIQEIIDKLKKIEPAKFNWRDAVRRFVGTVKTSAKKTRRKESKRYPDAPGIRVIPKKHILLGIDTSGSVSTNELKEFINEMWHIQKTGAQITVVQFDAAIHSIEKFDHRKDFKVIGRGGTNFDPVVDYANENYRKFSCLMIMTDGEAPAPVRARLRTMWVHSSTSNINERLIGHKIKLN